MTEKKVREKERTNTRYSIRRSVCLLRCPDYQRENVENSVRKAWSILNGQYKKMKAGDKVLLKPNLLSPHLPEEAITTHPALVEAVTKLVKDAGAVPLIGDSPGGAFGEVEKLWERTGMKKVAQRTGAKLVNFEKAGSYVLPIPKGKILKQVQVSNIVKEVDYIISLPKLKTHGLTVLTGAIKNIMGFVPGLNSVKLHALAPRASDFAELLVDLWQAIHPDFNIMDGIWALEGNGPSTGGNVRPLGLILAGQDCLALDIAFSRVVGLEQNKFPTLTAAISRLGAQDIEETGVPIENLSVMDFKLPGFHTIHSRILSLIPKKLAEWALNQIRVNPVINQKNCSRCHLCKKSCPADCIRITDSGNPSIDLKRCLACLCCFEVCPEAAITLKKSFLARMTGR